MNPCSFCPANCCKSYIITATAFDVLRVMEETKKPYGEFAMLHQARLLAFDPDTTLDMEDDGWVYILGFRSHPCAFLEKDNKCAIHDSAPMACRRFPFTLTNSLNARFCPLASQLVFRVKGPDITAGVMVRELEVHKRLVKEWNGKPGKKAECIPFLLERAKEMVRKPAQESSYTSI
jgi:Fe-S-cluster containining protein